MRLPVVIAVLVGFGAASAFAKLPPLSDEAKAKATDAAAKSAWTDKVGVYQLCVAMDRSAQFYRTSAKDAGQEVAPAVATPPCAEPDPFTPATPAAAKPLEASGAHSPPGMATSPPSSNATSAQITGARK
jgi:hypothetical protein